MVGINNDNFDLIQLEKGTYFVRTLLFDKKTKFSWNLVTVYGDAQREGKEAFLAELSRLYQDNPLPCVIGGISISLETVQRKINLGWITSALFLMLLLNMLD